ncbi:MAG: hypothetical protein LH624_05510 [Cryobacterium sp.]|nr:hypothetical protein [Cryobacterium sp.]
MTKRNRVMIALAVLFAGIAGTLGILAVTQTAAPRDGALAAAAVMTEFPGLAAASGEPDVESMATMHPLAGSVAEAPGPFDDRFEFESLSFDRSAVTGVVRVTSDVSDLLELQVVAGFYGADGALIGTDRFVHHLNEEGHTEGGPPVQTQEFSVAVPAGLADSVASVAVGVPVLVNE